MSFFLRGACMSGAAFFLLYVVIWLVLLLLWRGMEKKPDYLSSAILYSLRMSPLAGALALVGLFVVPSFLRLEPRQMDEKFGLFPLALAIGSLAVIAAGLSSVLRSWWRTARMVADYTQGLPEDTELGVPAVQIEAPAPLLLVAGALRPKLLISRPAALLLADGALHAAIRHECAHVRSHDNLKKLLLSLCPLPLLAGLNRAWLRAAELAADDAATTDENGALDLASALLKMARHQHGIHLPGAAMSLAPPGDTALRARIERLLCWRPRQHPAGNRNVAVAFSLAAVAGLVIIYGPLLGSVHELTELLFR